MNIKDKFLIHIIDVFVFFYRWNQQLVRHVLTCPMVVLSYWYHYNLYVFPLCPNVTQKVIWGLKMVTSHNGVP